MKKENCEKSLDSVHAKPNIKLQRSGNRKEKNRLTKEDQKLDGRQPSPKNRRTSVRHQGVTTTTYNIFAGEVVR